MKTKFLAIQSTYTHVQMGIFDEDGIIADQTIDKLLASQQSILVLEQLLNKAQCSFQQLSFIAVNQGPGPFTTLRVVISIINGLSFASKIPLIGINGIHAFLEEYASESFTHKMVLLNAFATDFYYGIQHTISPIASGYGNISFIITTLKEKINNDKILCLGNGVLLCKDILVKAFGHNIEFLDPNPEMVSLNHIAYLGLKEWHKQENISYQLQPLYYKPALLK